MCEEFHEQLSESTGSDVGAHDLDFIDMKAIKVHNNYKPYNMIVIY